MISFKKLGLVGFLTVGVFALAACGDGNNSSANNAAYEGCVKTINSNMAISQAQRDQLIKEGCEPLRSR